MTTTSAKDGSFSFEKVPYGKWIVREIEQPKGFVLDEKAYEVNISKAEQVVEIEIVNEYVHGNIRLTKVDAEYPDNKLTGATFEVYKDTNENGKIDDGDELIGNLEETETGIYEMKELLYGNILSVKQKHRRASCLILENTLFSLRKTKQLIPLRIRQVSDLSMKLCVEH